MSKIAYELRVTALKMTSEAGSSHIGSMFSIAEIIEALYFNVLKVYPSEPTSPDRDFFYLSKGHAGGIALAALAKLGFFPSARLDDYYKNGSELSGHLSHKVPGVELSTGSLGHALGVACGTALGVQKLKLNNKVFCLLSDGELNEGSNWEAFLHASHNKLNNLCAIVDYNKLQSLAAVDETLKLEPLQNKFLSFGWNVIEVDGHNVRELVKALNFTDPSKPKVIIANTVKGKGVSFMENSVLWHYRCARGEEYNAALSELSGNL